MKYYRLILAILLIVPLSIVSQEEVEKKKERPERPAFESNLLIDTPTNVVFNKNTLEVYMGHRFGEINNDKNDLAGFWGAANIRIAVAYSFTDWAALGFGTTKDKRLQDFNWKFALLRQTRSGSMPFSVSYYGNFTIDARSKDNFLQVQDRYSYFNQLILARRFNSKFSLQAAVSVSHYNLAQSFTASTNDIWGLAVGARYKVSPQTAIIVDYTQPFTDFDLDEFGRDVNPEAGISFGVEFATSSHTFQIFATNLKGIVPQENYVFNATTPPYGQKLMIGFNITRNYNF